ncbi:hypothetical protein Misp01_02290 [Microtetraspora sp. NBRC 13810]|uniref:sensor histidine kinase n=1 Tax=Microtetraspora sp. NBRC 13810 TaxID=3030990 RepID=UPI0024A20127|nr:histidine kinase [Microtetraspora sp. NBRC 13810]GLW05099.1 hypothetical protein Misp01_02290 [Microtetraspora sp. NBRC 13810]
MRVLERLQVLGLWLPAEDDSSHSRRVRRVTYLGLGAGALTLWLMVGGAVLGAIVDGTVDRPGMVVGLAGAVVISLLYLRAAFAAMAGRWISRRELVLSGVVAMVVVALREPGSFSLLWGTAGAVWAGGAALGTGRRGAAVITVIATLGCSVLTDRGVPGVGTAVFFAVMCTLFVYSNRFQLWFWQVLRAAEEGRRAQADLAVTQERLRFARDLHDLVGHSLSAIAVKSEVATRLATTDGERAAAEMAEVRGLAREALREIRTAVRGYRTVDLHEELRSVRAVLEAGGVTCELDMTVAELPQDIGTLLAWVLREGTTNVLRHSRASRCRIALTVREGSVMLEMRNDGVSGEAGGPGSGLPGLAERVASLGGVLKAGPDGAGRFLLRAAVPLGGVA